MIEVTLFDVEAINNAKSIKEQWNIILQSKKDANFRTRGQHESLAELMERQFKIEQLEMELNRFRKAFIGDDMNNYVQNRMNKLAKKIKELNKQTVVFEV